MARGTSGEIRWLTGVVSTLAVVSLALAACGGRPIPLPTQTAPNTTGASQASSIPSETATTAGLTATLSIPVTAASTGTATAVSYNWKLVTGGLDNPIGIANAGDGSGRLFVLEKPGRVRIIQGGKLLATPFLDISGQVRSSGSEQGLLGIVFDPGFKDNGFFYVDYTNHNNAVVLARFKVSNTPGQADPASETQILSIAKPYTNHNGGQLAFGPDGFLYIGVGDGGSEGDPLGNGQSLSTLLGKILRIDVHQGGAYAIPPDNPFAKSGGRPEIWAYGLRNPWRFSFDPATGALMIGDVGQDSWEEVDFVAAGYQGAALNFGWSIREGMHPYLGRSAQNGVTLTDPVWEYDHSQGCAIIGGVVYRGSNLPALAGVYLVGDYCSGNIWGLTKDSQGGWQGEIFYQTGFAITSFGVDETGEIYLTDQHGGIYNLGF